MSASASVNLEFEYTYSIITCCCLCLSSTSADHRKRKRLRTDTCAEAREVLVSLSGPFLLQTMLRDHAAVLCSACQRDLCRIAKLSLLPRESLASETT